MAETTSTGAVALALAAGYLFLRKNAKEEAPTPTGAAQSSSSGKADTSDPSTIQKVGAVVATGATVVAVGAKAVPALGALGTALGASGASAVGLGAAAVGLEVAGVALGYEQGGVPGAILGGLNPITGNAATAGFNLGKGAVADLGGNEVAQDTAGVGGAILGGLVSLGELATAAALLPTLGLLVGLGELIGEVLGIGSGGPDTPPPTVQQQVDGLVLLAQSQGFQPQVRINAAAQLVAWANGPYSHDVKVPGSSATVPVTNPYRIPARQRVIQLGAGSLLTT